MKYMTILLAIILTVGLMVGCAQKPPTVTKVDQATASAAGGTEITITGTGFKAAPVPTVTIGGNPATGVKVINKTTLKATVPPGAAGPADIVVQNAKAKVKSLPSKVFTYYEDVTAMTSIPDMASAPPEGIDAPAKIDVTFNQDVDPTTVIVKVMDAASAEVVGKVAPDAADPKMFSFTPDAPIKAGDYTATVSGAKGVAAQNIMADMSVAFKVKEAAKPAKGGKASKKGK
ncbi:MAG: IPT/TIG domain-containing protein [Candidatus Poribacteria bacterium]